MYLVIITKLQMNAKYNIKCCIVSYAVLFFSQPIPIALQDSQMLIVHKNYTINQWWALKRWIYRIIFSAMIFSEKSSGLVSFLKFRQRWASLFWGDALSTGPLPFLFTCACTSSLPFQICQCAIQHTWKGSYLTWINPPRQQARQGVVTQPHWRGRGCR
jgi:hypothetical protein